jgi:UDP-N-acetylmuramoyl-tripeptide--D-alanyl-D-alanine ligase
MRIPVAEAARVLRANVIGSADVDARGVSYDSRTLQPGNLFVAVVAARDGHDFVNEAVRAGAAAVLVQREVSGCPVPQIVVESSEIAFAQLAEWGRTALADRVEGRVIGITGSVGKTSTKDFVAAALGSRFTVGASEKSLNNDLGLPSTILNAPDHVEALVLEMGMRGFGEIARLARIARPDIAIITRVGEAHSERVGGIDGVRRAKAELVEAIDANGFALLNADDERVVSMRSLTSAGTLTYGAVDGADMRITEVVPHGADGCTFSYESRWGSGTCRLPVVGVHMASNAAAALLASAVVGCELGAAARSLESVELSPMRMAIHRLSGLTIVDDSYNASPTSVIAALETLASLPAVRRLAVLGQMAEIDEAERRHLAVAARASELGIELLAYGTGLYGVEPVDQFDEVLARVRHLEAGSAVLFKASRVVGLDRMVRALVG